MLYRLNVKTPLFRLAVTAIFLAGWFSFLSGCASFSDIQKSSKKWTWKAARKITRIGQISFTDSGLKKRIAVGAIDDKTGFEIKNYGELFQKSLVENLRGKCTGNRFLSAGDPDYPDAVSVLPRQASGQIDNFALARIGRQQGLNAVMTGTVIDIREYSDERGVLWFRDTHSFIQILVNVRAFDMETGAKLADESYLYESELDPVEFEGIEKDKKSYLPVIDEAIADATEFLGDELCDALKQQSWSGYVTAAEGGRIDISSGSDAGLTVGKILDVYARGEVIQGGEGQRFFKPGKKAGEIRLTEVYPNRAVAENLTDQPVEVGSTVRPK